MFENYAKLWCRIRLKEAREFLKGIMAFLDSTGELTDEARAAFMEAMIEEEDSEEEEEPEVNYFLESWYTDREAKIYLAWSWTGKWWWWKNWYRKRRYHW